MVPETKLVIKSFSWNDDHQEKLYSRPEQPKRNSPARLNGHGEQPGDGRPCRRDKIGSPAHRKHGGNGSEAASIYW